MAPKIPVEPFLLIDGIFDKDKATYEGLPLLTERIEPFIAEKAEKDRDKQDEPPKNLLEFNPTCHLKLY